jgi:predicted transcriptional regulator
LSVIRNFESLEKAEGNLMPCTLKGLETIAKDIADSMDPIPRLKGNAIQNYGTLFKLQV